MNRRQKIHSETANPDRTLHATMTALNLPFAGRMIDRFGREKYMFREARGAVTLRSSMRRHRIDLRRGYPLAQLTIIFAGARG